ncbi:MAG: hypothetical protein MHM6MM_003498 [Cercozoa sp. M6MM]
MRLLAVAALCLAGVASTVEARDLPPQRFAYDEDLAYDMTLHSYTTYCNKKCVKKWDSSCLLFADKLHEFEMVAVVENSLKGLFGYVGYDATHDRIVVSFRGSKNPSNWLGNIKYEQVKVPEIGASGLVHKGFAKNYLRLQRQVTSALYMATRDYPTAQIVYTGHSLGGVFAVLAAVDQTRHFPDREHVVYTIGCPRIGDDTFYADDMGHIDSHFRLVNGADVVAAVPPRSIRGNKYRHAYQEVFYTEPKKGAYKLCDESAEDTSCSVGTLQDSVSDHSFYFGVLSHDACGKR